MNRNKNEETEMLDEYDFTGEVRGKHIKRLTSRKNIVVLEPDVAEVFNDSKLVN